MQMDVGGLSKSETLAATRALWPCKFLREAGAREDWKGGRRSAVVRCAWPLPRACRKGSWGFGGVLRRIERLIALQNVSLKEQLALKPYQV